MARKTRRNRNVDNVIELVQPVKNTSVLPLALPSIKPLKRSQDLVFQFFESGKNVCLHGTAGTGKTFISLYLALKALQDNPCHKSITIIRSVVPTRDVGFLPGNAAQKAAVYEAPYTTNVNQIFGRGDAYDLLKKKNIIKFETTSFLRGINLDKTVVIVDEVQNMLFDEINTIMTRIGKDTRLLVIGDTAQNDIRNQKGRQQSGIEKFLNVSNRMVSISKVEFDKNDIVRSGFVREWIEACEETAA